MVEWELPSTSGGQGSRISVGKGEWGAVSSVLPQDSGVAAWFCCGSTAAGQARVFRNTLKPDEKLFSLPPHWSAHGEARW